MMKKSILHFSLCIVLLLILCDLYPGRKALTVRASGDSTDSLTDLSDPVVDDQGGRSYGVSGSGYTIYIRDGEDLLRQEEEDSLLTVMKPVTQFGHAAFITGRIEDRDAKGKSEKIYHDLFAPGESGILFMIDMGHRELIIFSDGDVYRTINKQYANTITDNVYKEARRGDYYACASKAFSQINTKLRGGKIAEPMKHITNAMLALILSALILYFISRWNTSKKAAKSEEILALIGAVSSFAHGKASYNHKSRTYNPRKSGSGGGGGGGGGSSGGGGSHGF